MENRRKEPFRYSLTPPIGCMIQITTINQADVASKLAEAVLIDISKAGCRIQSDLNLYVERNEIGASVHLHLVELPQVYAGNLRWQRQVADGLFHYGMQLELDDNQKEQLNIDLRTLAAERKIIVI